MKIYLQAFASLFQEKDAFLFIGLPLLTLAGIGITVLITIINNLITYCDKYEGRFF